MPECRDGDQATKTQMARACPKNGPRTDAKGISLGEAQQQAKDRTKWKELVLALCLTRDEED